MTRQLQPKWTDLRKRIAVAPRRQLVTLFKELFNLSEQNRTFLVAKLLAESRKAAFKEYRKRVRHPFYPRGGGFGELKLADARRAIREYEKATHDREGALELLMIYLETGTQFTTEFGDIDARFYNSLESALDEIIRRLRAPEGRHLYPSYADRLSDVAAAASHMGWGFGDYVGEQVQALADEFANDAT
jgi:hypothetical protein